MKRLLKPGNAIAAEYIARGENGKHTIINAYTGNIRVQELPARFPLGFYLEVLPHADTPSELRIELKIGQKTRAEIKSVFEFEEGKGGLLVIPQIQMEIPKATDITVVAHADGYAPVTLFKTSVEQGKFI